MDSNGISIQLGLVQLWWNNRVGVGIMSQLSIVALFLEMDCLRILKIAPDIK